VRKVYNIPFFGERLYTEEEEGKDEKNRIRGASQGFPFSGGKRGTNF